MIKVFHHNHSHTFFSCIIVFTYTILSFYQVCIISFTPGRSHNYHHTLSYQNSASGSRYLPAELSPILITTSTTTTTTTTTTLRLSPYQEENEREEEKDSNESSNSVHNSNSQRESEFMSIEPRERTSQQEERTREELHIQNTFVPHGNKLWELRSRLKHLSKQLIKIMAQGHGSGSGSGITVSSDIDSDIDGSSSSSSSSSQENIASEQEIQKMIHEAESKDAEHVYALEKENMERAFNEDRLNDAEMHKEKALIARSVLPHFNLHGLWFGNYGDQGYNIVNVTYVGDTLIARKVTQNDNVPAGEISFQADLSPSKITPTPFNDDHSSRRQPLANIILSEKASKKWKTKELPRFAGLGHVAEEGFANSQWMDGQLVYINENYFSFAWMPINYQILLTRPSNDVIMKMMKEQEKKVQSPANDNVGEDGCIVPPDLDDDFDTLNQHVGKCFDVTTNLVDECSIQDDSSSCIFYDDDPDVYCFE